MNKKEVLELLEKNQEAVSELSDYIKSYIEWVRKNIPKEKIESFGVGVTCDSNFGTYYGFYNPEKHEYTCTGSGWYVNNSFNLRIDGSTAKQMQKFAKEIPSLIESGMKEIKKESEDVFSLLENKIPFE